MTLAQLRTRTRERTDATGSTSYYTDAQVNGALNEGLRFFAFATLSVERTAAFTYTGGEPFVSILTDLPDFIVPLRVRVAASRKRLNPARLDEIAALDPAWLQLYVEQDDEENDIAEPDRYMLLGCDLFGLFPRVNDDLDLAMTYAASPAVLTADGQSPEIEEEHHLDLIDYAIWRLRANEGGDELSAAADYLERFLQAINKVASHVRAKARAGQYDRAPLELELADISKVIRARPPSARKQPAA